MYSLHIHDSKIDGSETVRNYYDRLDAKIVLEIELREFMRNNENSRLDSSHSPCGGTSLYIVTLANGEVWHFYIIDEHTGVLVPLDLVHLPADWWPRIESGTTWRSQWQTERTGW